MKKLQKLRDRKLSKPDSVVKYEMIKKKCENCSNKFLGTKYQKWCAICRKILSNVEWDWHV